MVEVERDLSCHGYEITDYEGTESLVLYYKKGEIFVPNPLYKVGFGKHMFIVTSILDGGKRVNRLCISDKILKKMATI